MIAMSVSIKHFEALLIQDIVQTLVIWIINNGDILLLFHSRKRIMLTLIMLSLCMIVMILNNGELLVLIIR
ncbi:hypothetical protein CXP54_03860 [Escherichia albertii]|nr:hypothetical protein CXP54_03860 [Escherichia albertii]EAB1451569.1 hypothetical protein [Escherichia albertii]EFO0970546.1 hypothetical protein [Escherichia albertii]EFO1263453.1 hypothetical protein [Escherichia albertii]PFF95928.1 hypothetical protein CRH02_10415 [Escherichia albertii]